MQCAQVFHGGGAAQIADKLLQLVDINGFVKKDLRIAAVVQHVRNY